MTLPYTDWFYELQQEGSLRSANVIVPIIMEAVSPQSAVDMGCGVGGWLSVFAEHEVDELLGMDGDYVPRDRLKIPIESFLAVKLPHNEDLGRTFDVALSLEVAEHLPKTQAVEFVRSLTRLAPVVVFSAAVPYQGGVGHANERWPSFWAGLFREQQYLAVDLIRPRVWDNDDVQPWYKQNVVIYVDSQRLGEYPMLEEGRGQTRDHMLDVVHPVLFEQSNTLPLGPLPALIKWCCKRAWRDLKQKIKRLVGRSGN